MYEYPARLVRVIDGDTYVLDIDLGFHVWTRQHIRLLGLDCPEIKTKRGKDAARMAQGWFDMNAGACIVRTGKDPAVTFERWVAQVYTLENGASDLAVILRTAGMVK